MCKKKKHLTHKHTHKHTQANAVGRRSGGVGARAASIKARLGEEQKKSEADLVSAADRRAHNHHGGGFTAIVVDETDRHAYTHAHGTFKTGLRIHAECPPLSLSPDRAADRDART